MGTPVDDPIRLNLPQPARTKDGWRGEVIHIDHFGNISTNIRFEHLGTPTMVVVSLGGITVEGLVETFGERGVGELVALYGSTGNLIVSVVNGDAAKRLGAKAGDPVAVEILEA